MNIPKTASEWPFLDTKLAVEQARQLKTHQSLFVVISICSPLVLSHSDVAVEPRCGHKGFWTFCLLLAAIAAPAC